MEESALELETSALPSLEGEIAAAYVAAEGDVLRRAMKAFEELADPQAPFLDADRLVGSVHPQAAYLVRSMIELLCEEGVIDDAKGLLRWTGRAPPEPFRAASDADRVIEADAFLRMMRHWSSGFRDFVSGAWTGVQVLFPRGSLDDWAELHGASRVMGHYGRLGASVVAETAFPGARVLEVGGGTGSALRHLVNGGHLCGLSEYCFTDISPAFFRAAWLREHAAVVGRPFNFERSVASQGLATSAYDLVLGVNALHAAQDLGAAIANTAEVLKPGGRLVLAEGAPSLERHWRPDLLFGMLPGWWDVRLDPVLRPRSGFLTLGEWVRALSAHHLEVDVLGAAATFRDSWHGGVIVATKRAP